MTFAQTVLAVILGSIIYDIVYTIFLGRDDDSEDPDGYA